LRRTTLISLAFFILALAVFFGLRYFEAHPLKEPQPTPAPEVVFTVDPAALQSLTITTPTLSIRAVKDGDNWRVFEPAGADGSNIPEIASAVLDLIILRTLDVPASEIGIQTPPRLEITMTDTNARTETLTVGSDTPTGTGTYARLADGKIVLLRTVAVQSLEDLITQLPQP
jgi:hypothetical protein